MLAIVFSCTCFTGCQAFRERLWFPGKPNPAAQRDSTQRESADRPVYIDEVYDKDSAQMEAYRKRTAQFEKDEQKKAEKKPWYKSFYLSDRGREIDQRFGE